VKTFPEPEAAAIVAMLGQVRHRNFQALLDCFSFQNHRHVILEHVPVSLAQVVVSPPYLTERQVAAIVGQVSFRAVCEAPD
jgi:hypothetical protein